MDYIAIAQSQVAEKYPNIIEAYHTPLAELKKIMPAGAIFGTFTVSRPGKERYVLNPDVMVAIGVTPGDLIRTVLADQYPFPLARRPCQLEEKCYNAPLLARRGLWGECDYVDISSCYASILRLGYDLEYRRGLYLFCEPRPLPPEIKKHKLCYSIGVAMSKNIVSNIEIGKGNGETFISQPYNMFSNPCLYNLAQDTQNAIASEIVRVLKDKIYYYNTDGCIVHSDYTHYVQDIIQSWGFSSKIKGHGTRTEVFGVASYYVDKFCHSKKFNRMSLDYWQGELMTKQESLWLKARWQKLLYNILLSEQETTT